MWSGLWAEDVVFPMLAKIINVKEEPYLAKGDGKTDDTKAIQQALNDHPNGDYIIYLPQGTYLISNTLSWPTGKDTSEAYRRTILQGQHKLKTVIKLKDGATGFDNPEIPKAMLYTGLGPAPRFRNAVRDLTLLTGKNNPGVIGLRFNAAVQGTVHNVNVKSEDGHGAIGIDMSFAPYIGPLLVKHVEVEGFDKGIFTGSPYNGMTLEHVILKNQKEVGLLNIGQVVTARGLTVRGNVPAIQNYGGTASLTLINSKLEHDRSTKERGPAILNAQGAVLFARRITVAGYSASIQDDDSPGGGVKQLDVGEYGSHSIYSLCSSPNSSLNLPVSETPLVYWGYVGNWVAISGDYGGTQDGADASDAIQNAIDNGAETIFFNPGGRYTITKDVYIRKNVRRIIGVEARIDGSGKFVLEDGIPPIVIFERFGSLGSGIFHISKRRLVIKNSRVRGYESREMAAGDLFLEDVSMEGPMRINYQQVWARQLHLNWDKGSQIVNHGGDLWVLGLTTTDGQNIIHTRSRGKTEILGAHVIVGPRAKSRPMIIADSSDISIAGLRESAPKGNAYFSLVQESRPDQTVSLRSAKMAKNTEGGSIHPLFIGYLPQRGVNQPPQVKACPAQLLVLPNWAPLTARVRDDGRGVGYCTVPVIWSKVKGDGRVAFSHQRSQNTWISFFYPGTYEIEIEANDGELKGLDTAKIVVWDRKISTLDHSGDNVPSGRGADSWVSSAKPTQNYGKTKALRLCGGATPSKAYFRFDLNALPGPVNDAALQFKAKARPDSPTWKVYGLKEQKEYGKGKLNALWDDNKINWNNAPGLQQNGEIDIESTFYLGDLTKNPNPKFGYYFNSRAMTRYLKGLKTKIATIILSSEENGCDEIATRELGRTDPPSLYLNYHDPHRSLGGEVVKGGYKMSAINVDPFKLEVSFKLLVANPQVVRIEVLNSREERMLLLQDAMMEGDVMKPYKFDARFMPTGNYLIRVQGEGFSGEGRFILLN